MLERRQLAIIGLAGAAAWLWPASAESPVAFHARAPAELHAAPAPPVRIAHEFVEVEIVAVERAPAIARKSSDRVDKADTPPEPERRGLLARTRRLLVGDGKHRPAPFPAVKN